MTHNVEKSFTCPKCEKFSQKGNTLQHVKNIHETYGNFTKRYSGYVYELFFDYISLSFDLAFVK